MSSEPKSLDDDEKGIVSSKKHQHRSSSGKKPATPFVTRVVRRLRDGCDEFIERMEDMEHGYRDKSGKKTQKGIEHEYELERRRKKRDARRRERQEREGGKDGEGGAPVEALMSGGRGVPPHHGEHSRRGGYDSEEDDLRGMHSEDPSNPPPMTNGHIHEARPGSRADPVVPLPATRHFGHEPPLAAIHPNARPQNSRGPRIRSVSPLPGPDRGRRSHGSRVLQRDVSPMPSEHSASSILAQVNARRNIERTRPGPQAGRGSQARRTNPLDSEDEERPGSDEGSSSEDEDADEAAKAARARRRARGLTGGPAGERAGPRQPLVETAPPSVIGSGLRGGAAAEVEHFSDDIVEETEDERESTGAVQYNEHEDFDDEYRTAAGTDEPVNEEHEEPRQTSKQKEIFIHAQPQENLQEESHKMDQTRERRPYNFGAQAIAPETFSISPSQQKTSGRTSRPYANPNVGESTRVRLPGAPGNTRASYQHKPDEARYSSPKPDESGSSTSSCTSSSWVEDDPMPEPQTRTRFDAAGYSEARRHYSARSGMPQEANPGWNNIDGAGQTQPRVRNSFGHQDEASRFPTRSTTYNSYFQPYVAPNQRAEPPRDEYVERSQAAFREQYATGAGSAFRNDERYTMPHTETAPNNPFPPGGRNPSYEGQFYASPRGPQPSGSFGAGMPSSGPSGAGTSFRQPGRVPENQNSPRRKERRYSPSVSLSSDTGDSLYSSSDSEDSSDTDSEPSPRRRRNQGPRRSSTYSPPPRRQPRAYQDPRPRTAYSPPPPRQPRAYQDPRRPGAYSPPPPPLPPRPNQGLRPRTAYRSPPRTHPRAYEDPRGPPARSPPPPRYSDVVQDTPPNHYARLGLSEHASADEIKRACRTMRVKTHPDQVKREKPYLTAEDMVRVTAVAAQVGEAADVLGDSSQKRVYDDMIRVWKRRHGGRLPMDYSG